jgi:hypothetical protein
MYLWKSKIPKNTKIATTKNRKGGQRKYVSIK